MNRVFGCILLMICGFAPAYAQDETNQPSVAPRELVILKPGLDRVWGTWVVAVMNKTGAAKEFSFQANLPREAVDFQPGEGVEAKDLQLSDSGLIVKKTFAPGVNVVGLSFAVPADSAAARITLLPARSLPELIVMTPSGMLKAESAALKFQGADAQDGQRYDVYTLAQPLAGGQSLEVQITGVPLGRKQLWTVGALFGVVLAALAVYLSWKTRPSQLSGTQEVV